MIKSWLAFEAIKWAVLASICYLMWGGPAFISWILIPYFEPADLEGAYIGICLVAIAVSFCAYWFVLVRSKLLTVPRDIVKSFVVFILFQAVVGYVLPLCILGYEGMGWLLIFFPLVILYLFIVSLVGYFLSTKVFVDKFCRK
ncbi:hypothetical protein EDC56_1503 [Sinobacterium caligoides]|uniref:Uncharacterized protein n=1 Tax=Sinobacterium caligoides TaxID=933926 RepID=A0A3N2DN52_9GAMM|nr:hypothetical protein [Sinobacterium caligoides]ROS01079.1 hypothetical protein EDC56_1503 [Sinobacterium caligoides]